jgi:hypothetical protein
MWRREVWYWLPGAGLLGVMIWLHQVAGLTLPTPWPDEAHFIWPALSLAQHGSLLSPELNPERIIMWMPPGLMLILAGVFKTAGVSLSLARGISLAALLGCTVVLLAMLRRYPLRFVSLLVVAAFFCTGVVTATGNVARPEAIMLFLVAAGFALQTGTRPFAGLAILALTPLIHPAGVLFFLSGLVAQAIRTRLTDETWPFGRLDTALTLLAALAWLGYLIHVVANWSWFLQDMTYQLTRKSGRELLVPLASTENALAVLLLVLLIAYAARHRLASAALLAVAIPAWLTEALGHEMWYDIYDQLAWMLLLIVAIQVGWHLMVSATNRSLWRRGLALVVILIPVGFLAYVKGMVPTTEAYPPKLAWQEFVVQDSIPYFAPEDQVEVGALLDSLRRDDLDLTVQFFPRGDAFLFDQILDGSIRTTAPVFCESLPDTYIIHRSRYLPRSHYYTATKKEIAKTGHASLSDGILVQERMAWERWYVFVPRMPAATLRSRFGR